MPVVLSLTCMVGSMLRCDFWWTLSALKETNPLLHMLQVYTTSWSGWFSLTCLTWGYQGLLVGDKSLVAHAGPGQGGYRSRAWQRWQVIIQKDVYKRILKNIFNLLSLKLIMYCVKTLGSGSKLVQMSGSKQIQCVWTYLLSLLWVGKSSSQAPHW